MKLLEFEDMIYKDGEISLSKAAVACSMINNDNDDDLIDFLDRHGIRAVITRAGGSGDNLKSKILRNTFGAAENSGLLSVTMKNRHALTQLVESLLRSFDSPLASVIGGGLKIGLVVRNYDLAIAVYGTLGLPGLDIDYEVSASRILYHCLED